MFRAIVTGIIAALLAGGCAFSPANLNVSYDSTRAKAGPLSSVKPLKVEVGDFADKRPQTDRIGYMRNGFGMETAKVSTTRPAPEIVREAIIAAFNKNGHKVNGGEKDIVVTVDVNVVVQDGRTGRVLLSKEYSGHHNTALLGGYHKEMADVMNAALENLIDQISGDPKLIDVFRSCSESSATSAQSRL
jgi:hypothetical protein